MNKIERFHLQGKALIYIRQSSMTQVRHNLESQKLQYDLEKRARALGWKEPVVIDEDLGKSASGGHQRKGFQFLLEEVCSGKVGAIFSIEASRLSRCGSEWHSLLEFCAIVGTLIIDPLAIYDPRVMDDRFLLGLKGTMSEMEVSMLRARTRSASIEKARRGELYVHFTTGFVLLPGNKLVKDPNRRVQRAIETVFATFERFQTIGKTTRALHEKKLQIPTGASKAGNKAIEWQLPQYSRIRGILTNPAYAGVYVYGRTRRRIEIRDGIKVVKIETVALEEALVVIKDHHEGYITWAQYERNQQTLKNNRNIGKDSTAQGAPRAGAALLAGMLRCGGCGCQLVVRYYGDKGKQSAYFCNRSSKIAGEKRCLYCSARQIDKEIEEKVLEVISPFGVAAALQAHEKAASRVAVLEEQYRLRLEESRYEAQRAQRQYDLIEPENRLVAAELERRWNQRLEQVAECERELEKVRRENKPLSAEQAERLRQLGEDFPQAWKHPEVSVEAKKRILRAVIEEIIIGKRAETLEVVIHWKGGDHTELTLTRRKPGRRTDERVLEIIRQLRGTMTDQKLAEVLNKEGLTTGTGLSWTEGSVQRIAQKRVKQSALEKTRLSIEQAAAELKIEPKMLKKLIARKKLQAVQVCAAAPPLIDKSELIRPTTQRAIAALKGKYAQQQDLDF